MPEMPAGMSPPLSAATASLPASSVPATNGSKAPSPQECVRVVIQCRPLLPFELAHNATNALFLTSQPPVVSVHRPLAADAVFSSFDAVFEARTAEKPDELFELHVAPLVATLFRGLNATVFAYGQTSAGKSYTMRYVTARVAEVLFEAKRRVEQQGAVHVSVRVGIVEIYRESIRDLVDGASAPLAAVQVRLRERVAPSGKRSVFLDGAKERNVENEGDLLDIVKEASLVRQTAATGMNSSSSRSHSIITISVLQETLDAPTPNGAPQPPAAVGGGAAQRKAPCLAAKLHLVDLAGSERAKRTAAGGERFAEGVEINKGLFALAKVISTLADNSSKPLAQRTHVPYRDSKLTRLLQDSLGGNARTLLIACVSPADTSREETLGTLRYAQRARCITNKPTVNTDANAVEVADLRAALARARAEIAALITENERLRPKNSGGSARRRQPSGSSDQTSPSRSLNSRNGYSAESSPNENDPEAMATGTPEKRRSQLHVDGGAGVLQSPPEPGSTITQSSEAASSPSKLSPRRPRRAATHAGTVTPPRRRDAVRITRRPRASPPRPPVQAAAGRLVDSLRQPFSAAAAFTDRAQQQMPTNCLPPRSKSAAVLPASRSPGESRIARALPRRTQLLQNRVSPSKSGAHPAACVVNASADGMLESAAIAAVEGKKHVPGDSSDEEDGTLGRSVASALSETRLEHMRRTFTQRLQQAENDKATIDSERLRLARLLSSVEARHNKEVDELKTEHQAKMAALRTKLADVKRLEAESTRLSKLRDGSDAARKKLAGKVRSVERARDDLLNRLTVADTRTENVRRNLGKENRELAKSERHLRQELQRSQGSCAKLELLVNRLRLENEAMKGRLREVGRQHVRRTNSAITPASATSRTPAC